MDKESGYMPGSIRGKQPIPPDPGQDQDQGQGEQFSKWEAAKSGLAGLGHGFFGTGVQNRAQHKWRQWQRMRGRGGGRTFGRGKRQYSSSNSWFKKICDRKEF